MAYHFYNNLKSVSKKSTLAASPGMPMVAVRPMGRRFGLGSKAEPGSAADHVRAFRPRLDATRPIPMPRRREMVSPSPSTRRCGRYRSESAASPTGQTAPKKCESSNLPTTTTAIASSGILTIPLGSTVRPTPSAPARWPGSGHGRCRFVLMSTRQAFPGRRKGLFHGATTPRAGRRRCHVPAFAASGNPSASVGATKGPLPGPGHKTRGERRCFMVSTCCSGPPI